MKCNDARRSKAMKKGLWPPDRATASCGAANLTGLTPLYEGSATSGKAICALGQELGTEAGGLAVLASMFCCQAWAGLDFVQAEANATGG